MAGMLKIHFKIAGFIDRKMVTAEFDLEAKPGSTVKDLFEAVDKSKKLSGKVMKKVLALPRPPTVLINGESIDVPDDYKRKLAQGDEVAVMTPVAGG